MSFSPDTKKQAQEVIFGRKSKAKSHHPLEFNNNNNGIKTISQKHLGITLDTRLPFEKHLEKQCYVKLTKLYVLSVSCRISHPEQF